MKVVRKHHLSQKAAMAKIDLLLQRLMEQCRQEICQPRSEWRQNTLGFAFRARGMDFKGSVEVGQEEVTLDVGIPLPLKPFEGRIRSNVEGELENVFPNG